MTDLDDRKAKAQAWFERLRNDICLALDAGLCVLP